MNTDTTSWIKLVESIAFPGCHEEQPLDKGFVIKFLTKATVMNELMHQHSDNYIKDLIESTYSSGNWNSHNLKSFLITDYPLSIIEPAFKDKYIPNIRNIKGGLYPYKRGREINACATLSPMGGPVIFFSEWLFAFLWDYFHQRGNTYTASSDPSLTGNADLEWSKLKKRLRRKLSSGEYRNLSMVDIAESAAITNSARYDLLFALFFIWGHELGHVFLGHCKKDNTVVRKHIASQGQGCEMREYNNSQQQELDADMFASDLFFSYLRHGFAFDVHVDKERFIWGAFELFRLIAEIENQGDYEDMGTATHPPTGLRLIYIFRRHEAIFREMGHGHIFEALDVSLKGHALPEYNWKKPLISTEVLR